MIQETGTIIRETPRSMIGVAQFNQGASSTVFFGVFNYRKNVNKFNHRSYHLIFYILFYNIVKAP